LKTLNEAKLRIPTQKEKIINLLRSSGSIGVTNKELQEVCIRWTARMSELYEDGYIINNEPLGNGIYNYVLLSEPDKKKEKSMSALDILLKEVKDAGLVSSDDLKKIIEKSNFNIHRKSGSHKQAI
jgi:hypothetical protein